MANVTDDFISRAWREIVGYVKTCGEAIGFDARQKSVVGARLNVSHKEDYVKTEVALKSMAEKTQKLADVGLDAKVEATSKGALSK